MSVPAADTGSPDQLTKHEEEEAKGHYPRRASMSGPSSLVDIAKVAVGNLLKQAKDIVGIQEDEEEEEEDKEEEKKDSSKPAA
ncbi:hypothetical protein HDU93_001518 [Gonapodya sp. JEL0774]|nr:hypothetical protein HDU93_001518 [Gonapodya sp. JEL0774]